MSDPPGAHLVLDGEMDEPELHARGGGELALFSCRKPGREGPNEDAAAILPFGDAAFVVVVADGMGGERAGAQASTLAVQALERSLAEALRDGRELRNAILDGIERASEAVAGLGVGAGTTLAAVEVGIAATPAAVASGAGTIRPYHVGDSGILLLGQRGKLKLQTVSHSPVGFAVEAGMLDEGEAMHHEHRHIVSNVLGAKDMRIEVGSERRIAARDTLLVASDGLWDNLHTDEISALLRTGPLDASCARLAELSRARMHAPTPDDPSKPDDLTFVAYRPTGVRGGRAGARSSRARPASPGR